MSCGCNSPYPINCNCRDNCGSNCTCTCHSTLPCEPSCGCPIQLGSECIFYKGTALPCLSTNTGTSLEDILKNINTVICTLNPSGQVIAVVETANSSHISVVTTTSGNTTTYTLDLSPTFTNIITNLTTDVNNIYDILADLPISITTGTPSSLSITNPSANVWNIDYIGATPPYPSGVIYNNCTQITRPAGAPLATTKSFTANYISTYGLTVGDVIKVRASFQLPTTIDRGSISQCVVGFSSGWNIGNSNVANGTQVYSFLYDIDINVISLSTGDNNALITANVFSNMGKSFERYTPNNLTSPLYTHTAHTWSEYTTINWTTLQIAARSTGSTAAVESRNDLLRIELLKKI